MSQGEDTFLRCGTGRRTLRTLRNSAILIVHGGIEAWHGKPWRGQRGPFNWTAVNFHTSAAPKHPRLSQGWSPGYREVVGFGFGGGPDPYYFWLARVPLWFPAFFFAAFGF
jgi:hypothetical protein